MIDDAVCNCKGFFVPHIRGTHGGCIYLSGAHREYWPDIGLRRHTASDELDEQKKETVAEYIEPSASAWGKQEGGDHYKNLPIQPSEYIVRNGLGWLEGNVIKYVTRHASKGGVEDLRKARHYLELLIEDEEKNDE